MKKKLPCKHSLKVTHDKDMRTFRVHATEEGDMTVGIPSVSGSIAIVVPDWLVPEDQGEEFEKSLAEFIEGWTDGGKVLTSQEQIKMEKDELEAARAEREATDEISCQEMDAAMGCGMQPDAGMTFVPEPVDLKTLVKLEG